MLELLKRTGVFLIIAETMYHFVNENKYARYIRLLISMMTMAMIVIPIGSFFTDSGMERENRAQQVQVSEVTLAENQICIVCDSLQEADLDALTQLFAEVLGVKEALLEVRVNE